MNRALVGDVGHDILFAFRLFRRSWRSFLVAFAGLALAIGFATVVFSAINALALRSIEVPRPEEVVTVRKRASDGDGRSWTMADFVRFRGAATLLRAEALVETYAPATGDVRSTPTASVPVH